jgi:hypothetical protein
MKAPKITNFVLFAVVAIMAILGGLVAGPVAAVAGFTIGALGVPAVREFKARRGIESKGHRGDQRLASGLTFDFAPHAAPAGGAPLLIETLNFYNVAPSGLIAANEDIFNGDPSTDVVSMENYQEIIFVISRSAGATGTATITVESCDDVVPTTTTAVAFRYKETTTGNTEGAITAAAAAGVATTAGANGMMVVSIRADELSGSDKFVRLVATEVVDSPVDGAIICVGGLPRYTGGILPDMTA